MNRELRRRLDAEARIAAERVWRPHADAGDAVALYEIARLYLASGDLILNKRGTELLHEASERGSGDALYEMTDRSGPDEQWEIIKRAATLGSTYAAHQLGACYATGERGLPKDPAEAFRWYKIGAELGDGLCQYDLGFMYLLGEGTDANVAEGLAWLEKAGSGCDWGADDAAKLLADIYEGGYYGVPPDSVKAEFWRHRRDELA